MRLFEEDVKRREKVVSDEFRVMSEV